MTSGAKTAIVVAGIAVIILFVMSRPSQRVGASNTDKVSNAGLFFQFGTAVTNLAGKIIGPSNDPESTDIDGPEDEYTGPGGYDTSGFRV